MTNQKLPHEGQIEFTVRLILEQVLHEVSTRLGLLQPDLRVVDDEDRRTFAAGYAVCRGHALSAVDHMLKKLRQPKTSDAAAPAKSAFEAFHDFAEQHPNDAERGRNGARMVLDRSPAGRHDEEFWDIALRSAQYIHDCHGEAI